MRRNLHQPLRLQRHITPHILLTRQHKLKVNHPPRVNLKQRARRVQIHGLAVLNRAVTIATALQACCVREEAGRNGLLDGDDVVGAAGADGDFDAVAQFGELIADVARAGETALLEEVFFGPDDAEVRVDPLVPDVEEGEVVTAFFDGEAVAGAVSVDLFVFGTEEERAGFAEH